MEGSRTENSDFGHWVPFVLLYKLGRRWLTNTGRQLTDCDSNPVDSCVLYNVNDINWSISKTILQEICLQKEATIKIALSDTN